MVSTQEMNWRHEFWLYCCTGLPWHCYTHLCCREKTDAAKSPCKSNNMTLNFWLDWNFWCKHYQGLSMVTFDLNSCIFSFSQHQKVKQQVNYVPNLATKDWLFQNLAHYSLQDRLLFCLHFIAHKCFYPSYRKFPFPQFPMEQCKCIK